MPFPQEVSSKPGPALTTITTELAATSLRVLSLFLFCDYLMAKIFLMANPSLTTRPVMLTPAKTYSQVLILMLTWWLTLWLTLSVVAGLRLAGNRVAARKNKEINMISAVGMSKGENSIGMAAGQHTQTTRSKPTMHSLLRYHS